MIRLLDWGFLYLPKKLPLPSSWCHDLKMERFLSMNNDSEKIQAGFSLHVDRNNERANFFLGWGSMKHFFLHSEMDFILHEIRRYETRLQKSNHWLISSLKMAPKVSKMTPGV